MFVWDHHKEFFVGLVQGLICRCLGTLGKKRMANLPPPNSPRQLHLQVHIHTGLHVG